MRYIALSLFLFVQSLVADALVPEKVLICAVCKNISSTLHKTIPLVETMGAIFEDYRVLIYENNSTDTTKDLLQKWSLANSRVLVTSENVSQEEMQKTCVNITVQGTFFRPEMIARARNIVLAQALSEKYQDFPYVIWFDLDFEFPFSIDGIVEVFRSKREWDGVFAFGVDPKGDYLDWYAFRDAVHPLGPEVYDNSWWTGLRKTCRLTPKDDWYPVYSAFGGLGIYKKSSIEGCFYSALVTPDLEACVESILQSKTYKNHPDIRHYFDNLNHLTHLVRIFEPSSNLPTLVSDVGVMIHSKPQGIVFRMTGGVAQYPSVCEHVPFHASMIQKGHGKLFINPRLVLQYVAR